MLHEVTSNNSLSQKHPSHRARSSLHGRGCALWSVPTYVQQPQSIGLPPPPPPHPPFSPGLCKTTHVTPLAYVQPRLLQKPNCRAAWDVSGKANRSGKMLGEWHRTMGQQRYVATGKHRPPQNRCPGSPSKP